MVGAHAAPGDEVRGMNIADAVREAMNTGACITLPEFVGIAKIRPTDGPGNCILSEWDGSRPSKYGWQPIASQLTREDWIIVTD